MSVTFCDKRNCRHHGTNAIEDLDSLILKLKEMLPHAYSYIICSCKGNLHDFEAVLRTNINQKDQATEWKAAFEAITKTTWRVARTFPHVQAKVIFKGIYRCQHKTNPRSSTADGRRCSKNTNCQAELRITVGRTVIPRNDRSSGGSRLSRSKDPHHLENPTEIVIKHCHNHQIHDFSALKHRDVAEETKRKIDRLLLDGYPPSAALEKFKFDAQLQDPDNYVAMIGDRALCPDLGWVYRRNYALGIEKYGGQNTPEALENFVASRNFEFMSEPAPSTNTKLLIKSEVENTEQNEVFVEGLSTRESEVQNWSFEIQEAHRFPLSETEQLSHQYVEMEVTKEQQNVVAICTPLMHRVHQSIKDSGETVFIDSAGNVHRSGYQVFLLMTQTCVGGLPLGVLITSNESTSTITAGLKLLCKIIGPSGFYGRGQMGPLHFMTDDSKSERAALRESFPESAQFLCSFHLLQAFWRFLWNEKTQVHRQHRQHIFSLIKSILFASDVTELDELCAAAMGDAVLSQYPHVRGHIAKNLLDKKDLWAIWYREDLLLRGNNSNNFCEAAMKVFKDQVLRRTKAFNVQQVVDFICHDFEAYYVQRCVDIAYNQLSRVQSRYLLDLEGITDESVSQLGELSELQFDVRSMSNPNIIYRVDMTVELCTCKQGSTGGPCKHKAAVVRKYMLPSWNFVPETDPVMRQTLYYLGTGAYYPPSWFETLKASVKSEEPGSAVVHSDNSMDESSEPSVTVAPEQAETTDGEQLNILAITKGLRDIFDRWIEKLHDDPESHAKAFENFLKNAGKLKSTSQLHSALHMFGKCSWFSSKIIRKKHLVSSKRIRMKPIVLQHRKRSLPGCKHLGTCKRIRVLPTAQCKKR